MRKFSSPTPKSKTSKSNLEILLEKNLSIECREEHLSSHFQLIGIDETADEVSAWVAAQIRESQARLLDLIEETNLILDAETLKQHLNGIRKYIHTESEK